MSSTDRVNPASAALFTDLYELTMLQAYFRQGMREEAVFDLFVRRLGARNYLIACGLGTVLDYLEYLRFSESDLAYLRSLGLFENDFLEYLRVFRYTGDVYAVREGTPIFADEPIVEIVAPIMEAQLIETFLLNQLTFQTNAATKAHRTKTAAGPRLVADFGMRRMHGTDAAMKAARAFYIGGIDSTSNVLAGEAFGLRVTGTMAHSYVEAHDHEEDAFRAFSDLYDETTLLVDTYDTLEGVRKVVQLAHEMGNDFTVRSVRLDSGDLASLARSARDILDDAGMEQVRIFASGSLDEYAIRELVWSGAPIDGFGVGTRMGTIADQPYLDSAYKLSGYAGSPRMKLSAQKSNMPGRKQVYRIVENGCATYDVIGTAEESTLGKPLLELVMKDGRRTAAGNRRLEEARSYARQACAELPEHLLELDVQDPPYRVDISPDLQQRLRDTRERLTAKLDGAA